MIRRGFVRALWGKYISINERKEKQMRRRVCLDTDMWLMKFNKYEKEIDPITFVFGEDNYKHMIDMGYKAIMLDKRPHVWDSKDCSVFRHKLEAFRAATEYFDEFIFLDLDCLQIKPLPANFWEEHYKKGPMQASLMGYKRRKAKWRKECSRLVPCACYVYIRDPQIPHELIKIWEQDGNSEFTEETIMAMYLDKISGGWQGLDYYWDRFEPEFYVFENGDWRTVNDTKRIDKDKICFQHFHSNGFAMKTFKSIINGNKYDWLINEDEMKGIRDYIEKREEQKCHKIEEMNKRVLFEKLTREKK